MSDLGVPARRSIEHVETLRNHWWWRSGWGAGRHFYACHLTFRDQPQLQRLVAAYQQAIMHIAGIDPIPAKWLHLTMQGIGFVDQVDEEQLADLTATIQRNIRAVQLPVVTFHLPVVRPEAVYLPAEPPGPICALRSAVHAAIVEVLGSEQQQLAKGYRPHVSLAYSNTDQPAAPIVEALGRVKAEPVTVEIRNVELLQFHRDQLMYEWARATPLAIGAEAVIGQPAERLTSGPGVSAQAAQPQ